jgi:hypothetical protein
MNTLEISADFICGAMLGFEFVKDEGENVLILDLLFIRIMAIWD